VNSSEKIKKFIHDNSFASITIGFLIAHSGVGLIESIINGFIMQLFQPLLGGVSWEDHNLIIGPFTFLWGEILSNSIHMFFVIIIAILLIRILQHEDGKENAS
jgi:large-conductance mechanosensitive channel